MKKHYSFVHDRFAIEEIKKHKWIESEKAGCEVGFATAAYDWINKHGDNWKKYQYSETTPFNVLLEERKYHRLHLNFPITIQSRQFVIQANSYDIDLGGISCIIPKALPEDLIVETHIHFKSNKFPLRPSLFKFVSQVIRCASISSTPTGSFLWVDDPDSRGINPQKQNCRSTKNNGESFKVVLGLNEQIRDYLKSHSDFFNPPILVNL